MESHVALSSGVTSTMVDYQTTGSQTAEKSLENLERKNESVDADTYATEHFNRNALLAPVVDRGTLFDILS